MSKSTIKQAALAAQVFDRWSEVEGVAGMDLETSAKATKALVRKREIQSATDLLRVVLLYSLCDFSLRMVGLWSVVLGIGYLSDVAILKRLQGCPAWLGLLIGQLLQRRCKALVQQAEIRLRLIDATTISRPGSQGTDWRLHLSMDLGHGCLDGIALTDASGGESLARFARQADEIWVADRGYAFARGLGAALQQLVQLVVRINWQTLPLQTLHGQPLDVIAWLSSVSQPSERAVLLPTPFGNFPLRLLASPLQPEKADRARDRARRTAAKKGRTVSPKTLVAAGFVLLLSNLPTDTWPTARIFWLYRLRWQIELHIKRLKSLLDFDQLRALDPRLAQTYLLGKLLAALLLEELTHSVRDQHPDWWTNLDRPLSVWRLTHALNQLLRQWVLGAVSPLRFLVCLPRLGRYLCNSSRARPQQDAWMRALLEHLACS